MESTWNPIERRGGAIATSFACAVLVVLTFAVGCSGQASSSQENTAHRATAQSLMASSTAEVRSDGTIRVRDATNQELSAVEALDEKIALINKRYPAPDAPQNGVRLKAVRVAVPGLIYFNNAPTVRIDGIRCSQRGVDSISKKILAPNALVAISPSVPKSRNPLPAVVWVTYPSTDRELASAEWSNAVADTALMNNLCEAEYSPTSKYNDRHAALAQAFSASAGRATSKSGR